MDRAADSPHFAGRTFEGISFRGTTLRDCDLREFKVADAWLTDVDISGHIERFVVNDVDVTDFVEAELDRRHPERAQLREMTSADEHRAMWTTIEQVWAATVDRARALPESARFEQVRGEWSFVETLRHLIFATDAWALSAILEDDQAFHPIGLRHASYPEHLARSVGIDPDAEPTFDEVLDARLDRMARVRRIVDDVTDEGLSAIRTRPPAPGYPQNDRTVGACLRVVMTEECEHHRYAVRDLARLEDDS